ncbi:MAG TPA: NIPSNAP family protein [Pirellulales bacterium]|nr:NIPSNAP family protein [Pirellulales bacterium]
MRWFLLGVAMCVSLVTASWIVAAPDAKSGDRVFELRTYSTHEGRLDALNARFREHTNKLFVKHGMELVGYWTPANEPESKNTLVYILAYPSREAQEASWKAFRADPEWQAVKAKSEADGPIVERIVSQNLVPTDYSPIK